VSKRNTKPARTMIIKHEDGYHLNYKRGEGFQAMIDSPYFSAISLGWFDSQTAAQVAVDQYRYDNACAGFGCVEGCGDCAIAA
jgi:hypothetical protein